MADQKCECPDAGNAVNVPITGITLPFCGFGVNIDASKLPKCECGLSREEVLAMLDALTGEFDKKLDGIGEKLVIVDEKLAACGYALCEFYLFRHPALKKGFERAEGGLLENAATLYPEAWAYLQTPEGQKLCKTEAEWQAMTRATWATLADGTKVGWDGIGGAPFYAPDLSTGALRLPDLRGMYAEAAGFDSLGVGDVHGDAIRDIAGHLISPMQCSVTLLAALLKVTVGSQRVLPVVAMCRESGLSGSWHPVLCPPPQRTSPARSA